MTTDRDIQAYLFTCVVIILYGALTQAAWAGVENMPSIEVFTTANRAVTGTAHEPLRSATVIIYTIDGLERFEAALSRGLPLHPSAAEPEALRRIQQLDPQNMAQAKHAAIGLAAAIQYGVDRYPAIVFDKRAVVYGVTDLIEALGRYRAWQRASAR